MRVDELEKLKYADLRNLAKECGIRANLKAEKLKAGLAEYYENAEASKSSGFPSSETDPNETCIDNTIESTEKRKRTETVVTPKQRENGNHEKKAGTGKRKRTNTANTPKSSARKIKRTRTSADSPPIKDTAQQNNEPPQDLVSEDESTTDEDKNPGSAIPDDLISEDGSPGVKDVVESLTGDMTSEQMKATLLDAINKRAKEKVEKNAPLPDTWETQIPRFTALGGVKTYSHKKPITPGNPDWSRIHQRQFDRMQGIDSYLQAKKQRTESLTTSMKKMRMLTQQMRSAVDSSKAYKTPPSLFKSKARVVKPVPAKQTTTHSNKALFQTPASKPFVPTVTSTSKANFNFASMNKSKGKSPAPLKAKSPAPSQAKSPAPTKASTVREASRRTPKPLNSKSPAVIKTKSKTPAPPVAQRKKLAAKRSTVTTPLQRTSKMSTPAQRLKSAPVRKSPRLSGISSPAEDLDISPTISFNPNAILNRSIAKENKNHPAGSAKKSTVTPFKFSKALNISNNMNSTQNTSVQKNKFDLGASLARPMTWRPHTGKLQPLKMDNIYQSQPVGLKAASIQSRAAAKKNNRRAMVQRARADKRLDVQNKRRGLVP